MPYYRDDEFQSIYTDAEVEMASKVAHNVLQAYNAYHQIPTLGQWSSMDKWYKASLTKDVELILNTGIKVQFLHLNWVRRMTSMGWVHGETYNSELKTDDRLVIFNQLNPIHQQRLRFLRAAVMGFRKQNPVEDTTTTKGKCDEQQVEIKS